MQLYFTGTPTYTLEIFHQVYWRKIPLYRINPIWLFQEGFPIAREPVFERMKRISDIFLSTIGLILAAIPISLAAIAIKIDDGGPVFFTQTRVGRHRVPFKLVKLRTMRESQKTGDMYTRKGDGRGSPGWGSSFAPPASTSFPSFGTSCGGDEPDRPEGGMGPARQ